MTLVLHFWVVVLSFNPPTPCRIVPDCVVYSYSVGVR